MEHTVPHNAVFRILGRNLPQAACLGQSNTTNLVTCGKCADSTNEYIKIIPIPSSIPTTMKVCRLEALQLGELLSQKSVFSSVIREGLVYRRGDACANFGNRNLLRRHVCDSWRRSEGNSEEGRATTEIEQGSANYFDAGQYTRTSSSSSPAALARIAHQPDKGGYMKEKLTGTHRVCPNVPSRPQKR
jgi:hypothetical protein